MKLVAHYTIAPEQRDVAQNRLAESYEALALPRNCSVSADLIVEPAMALMRGTSA